MASYNSILETYLIFYASISEKENKLFNNKIIEVLFSKFNSFFSNFIFVVYVVNNEIIKISIINDNKKYSVHNKLHTQ